MPKKQISKEKQDEIVKLYKEGLGKKKIASILKTSTRTITLVLQEQKIETHKSGDNGKGGRPYTGGRKPRHWLYQTWSGIKQRCYNINNNSYNNYGAKGIGIYSEWKNDFNKFKKYVEKNLGEKDANLSLDRINPKGDYEPGNIRWANKITQAYNKTNCFNRNLETVDTSLIIKNYNLDIKYYSVKELQINKEIEDLENTGVYIIKCESNNNYYIGSTSRSFRERWKEIRKQCKNNKNKISKYLRKFWQECDGETNFKFGILEITDNIKEREQYWISKLEPSLNIVKIVY